MLKIYCVSHKNKLCLYRKLWVETFLKKSSSCSRYIGPDHPWGLALAAQWGRQRCHRMRPSHGGDRAVLAQPPRAGPSYRANVHWHLAGMEYLTGSWLAVGTALAAVPTG